MIEQCFKYIQILTVIQNIMDNLSWCSMKIILGNGSIVACEVVTIKGERRLNMSSNRIKNQEQ